jgi:integrase
VLWRAGLRIHEALALSEADLDRRRGTVLVRRGQGGRRRQVGMDDWAWEHIEPWLNSAPSCPSGRCSASSADRPAGDRARPAPLARNFGQPPRRPTSAAASPPHQLRHAHAVEMAREGIPFAGDPAPARDTNLGITSICLQGIDSAEIIDTVHARRAPMDPIDGSLRT